MKYMLRALALTGVLGLAAGAAQAQVGIYVGARTPYGDTVVAVPPSPGPGYYWTDGYYDGPVWVPGRWVYGGDAYAGTYGYYGNGYRVYDRDAWREHEWREHEWREHEEREHYRDFDRDRYRDDDHRDRGYYGYRDRH